MTFQPTWLFRLKPARIVSVRAGQDLLDGHFAADFAVEPHQDPADAALANGALKDVPAGKLFSPPAGREYLGLLSSITGPLKCLVC